MTALTRSRASYRSGVSSSVGVALSGQFDELVIHAACELLPERVLVRPGLERFEELELRYSSLLRVVGAKVRPKFPCACAENLIRLGGGGGGTRAAGEEEENSRHCDEVGSEVRRCGTCPMMGRVHSYSVTISSRSSGEVGKDGTMPLCPNQ